MPRPATALWPARLVAALIGCAVVLIGATVGVTLWITDAAATTVGASAPPAGTTGSPPGHAAGPAGEHGTITPPGEASSQSLVTDYLKALNGRQGDTIGHYLCATAGTAADTVWGFSWTMVYNGEHVDPGQTQAIQSRTAVQLNVSFNGQSSGQYIAVLAQQDGRWCVQQVSGGGA